MTVVTRFAPSPTGRLHVGNIRTALHNFLFARKNGGRFVLRIDDTDRERSTAEFDQAIRDDLAWLGLNPDQMVRQSERFDLYEREFDRLKAAGAIVVKEPYNFEEYPDAWIATLADPDGNYFQLMTPFDEAAMSAGQDSNPG